MNDDVNKLSVSFRCDKGCMGHNNRKFFTKNIDKSRTPLNVIYVQRDIHEVYHELFDDALNEYNAKQKRDDRKIKNYYEHIRRGGREELFQEINVQFGDIYNGGYGTANWQLVQTLLDEYIRDFEKRNPNLRVFNSVMHNDESTPHLHIDFVPVCYNQKQGLSTRVSMKQALQQQGFIPRGRTQTEIIQWGDAERKIMTEILRKHGIEREIVGAKHKHQECEQYRNAQREISQMNTKIDILTKKPTEELTLDNVGDIINQNTLLKQESQKEKTQIHLLYSRVSSPFIEMQIYNSDKMEYIADSLRKLEVPFVEESNTLYIPEYAKNAAYKIAAAFKPAPVSIRERVKLDIDVLIYSADNYDDLINKLKERGYEVKRGKFTSVKPSFAQRFIRLERLGDDYLKARLEERIAERDVGRDRAIIKRSSADDFKKPFYDSIIGTMDIVSTFKYKPKKQIPKKIYSHSNDGNL